MAAHQGSPPAQPCRLRFECSRRSSVAVGRGAAAGAAARSPSCLPFAPASLASVRRSRAARCAAAPGPIVVIDNYDSFTYNLVQYLWDEGAELLVVRNDEKTCAEIAAMQPAGILVGPGPGAPEESGIALQACRELGPRFPLLGVCMGLQCIGAAFGGRVVRSPTGLMHGKQSPVLYDLEDEGGLLHGLPKCAVRHRGRVPQQLTRCAQPVPRWALPQPGHRARLVSGGAAEGDGVGGRRHDNGCSPPRVPLDPGRAVPSRVHHHGERQTYHSQLATEPAT